MSKKDYQCELLGENQIEEEEDMELLQERTTKTAFFDQKIFSDIPSMMANEAFNEF